jgi:hypothetical protein
VTARVMRSAVAERVRYAAVKAVEIEPDNAHPKTRSYERKHVWSIRTRLLSRAEPVTWPCSTWPSTVSLADATSSP